MKAGLFSYLAKQAVSQQIIIIENTNHMAGIPITSEFLRTFGFVLR